MSLRESALTIGHNQACSSRPGASVVRAAPNSWHWRRSRGIWLSRGLLEACLNYIRGTPVGDALRVAAYEFTYAPILKELRRATDGGVDVQIVYHDTSDAPGQPIG